MGGWRWRWQSRLLSTFAESEWGTWIACDTPTQHSSLACDDGGNFVVAATTPAIPVKAHCCPEHPPSHEFQLISLLPLTIMDPSFRWGDDFQADGSKFRYPSESWGPSSIRRKSSQTRRLKCPQKSYAIQSEKLLISVQWCMTSNVPGSSGRKPRSSVFR